MILSDSAGEIAVSPGDQFAVRSNAGDAKLEVICPDWTLGNADAPLICCRVVEGRVVILDRYILKTQAIVYYYGEDVATARRAFIAGSEPPPLSVRYFDAH